MSFIPKPQEIYKHSKGNLYQIVAVAEHTETGEMLVVYQALYGDFRTYARPLDMFVSRVDRSKYPEAEQEFRFELQGPEAERQKEESEPEEARDQGGTGAERKSREEAASETVGGKGPGAASETVGEKSPEAALETEEREETSAVESPEPTEPQSEQPEEEFQLDPLILEFLDTDDYLQRLNILAGLHHRITDDMITTMAIACDVEIGAGDTEERYEALKACLLTLERYECNRIR